MDIVAAHSGPRRHSTARHITVSSTKDLPFVHAELIFRVVRVFCREEFENHQEREKKNMSQKCEICGKMPLVGNRISHAHNVTKRRWMPNLQRIRIMVDGRPKKVNVCVQCLRTGRVNKAVKQKPAKTTS